MKAGVFLKEIRIEHTLFALPFAYTGAIVAARGIPSWSALVWITLAVLGARTAAMAINRYLDKDIDARNPRTARRALASGKLSSASMLWATAAGLALLVWSAWMLNPLCVKLLPIAALLLLAYPLCKRFTWTAHFVLGAVDGLAPLGAYVAITGGFGWPAVLLFVAVTLWVAGFDIIYSCQDYEFDNALQLYSVPRWCGIRNALIIARVLHVLMIVSLLMLVWQLQLGLLSVAGVAAVACLLIYEHGIVKADDLSRVNAAFFTMNGWVSVLFFVFWAADVWLIHQ